MSPGWLFGICPPKTLCITCAIVRKINFGQVGPQATPSSLPLGPRMTLIYRGDGEIQATPELLVRGDQSPFLASFPRPLLLVLLLRFNPAAFEPLPNPPGV